MALIDSGDGWSIIKSDDGIIRVKVSGDAADEHIFRYLEVWQRVIEENAPCLQILDASELDLSDLAKRWELASRMKKNRDLFKKSAVVGVEGAKKLMASIVIKASRRDNVKVFDNVEDAERWLLE
jgi:hypothetical protein